MIRITSIEIDGFIIPSQKVKLDFVESNIVCIYGNNGSGKTTFLEILFAVFDRDEKILEKYNVKKIIITVLNEAYPIKIEKIENMENWKDILENEIEDTKERFPRISFEYELTVPPSFGFVPIVFEVNTYLPSPHTPFSNPEASLFVLT